MAILQAIDAGAQMTGKSVSITTMHVVCWIHSRSQLDAKRDFCLRLRNDAICVRGADIIVQAEK